MADVQWHIFFADLSPTLGSEQAGRRPVIVVSRESIHRSLPVVGICPLTSLKPGRRIYATEVLIEGGCAGLTADSLVLGHQVRTIAKEQLGQKVGFLSSDTHRAKIRQALTLFLNLE